VIYEKTNKMDDDLGMQTDSLGREICELGLNSFHGRLLQYVHSLLLLSRQDKKIVADTVSHWTLLPPPSDESIGGTTGTAEGQKIGGVTSTPWQPWHPRFRHYYFYYILR
jgi:hypothetical protein